MIRAALIGAAYGTFIVWVILIAAAVADLKVRTERCAELRAEACFSEGVSQ